MELTLSPATGAEIRQIRELYFSAFPREERSPFGLMKRRAKQGVGRMLAAKDGGEFVGFTYIIESADCAYLFYLAIVPQTRGAGYGSAILAQLREMYADKRIFLARESLDESADNYEQRVRRHEFYLRNGFSDLNCKIRELTVTFDVMSVGGEITPEDYKNLIIPWCGKFRQKHYPMKLFIPTERK